MENHVSGGAGRFGVSQEDKNDPHPHVDAALSALAADQYGVFTTAQAQAAGIDRQVLSRRVRTRRLFSVYRGVYSLVPLRLLSPNGRKMAAVLAGGAGAGLSHTLAAIHTGFIPGSTPRILDITVPSHGGRGRDGLRIHRSALLRPADVEPVYKIPTTTVARTFLDLTGVLPREQVETAMDEAARMELLHLGDLREQAGHNQPRPEATTLTAILDAWDQIWSFTESQLEKLLLQGLLGAGLPRPELQQRLILGDGGSPIRADFLYRDARLILEADSWRWHAHRFEHDSKRDQRAAAAGYQTLRVTRRQVVTELDRITATIDTVYAQRRRLFTA